MKNIILILTFLFLFLLNCYTQDTTYVGLFIDSEKIKLDENFNFKIINKSTTNFIKIIDNEFFIAPDLLDSNFIFIIRYKKYELKFLYFSV